MVLSIKISQRARDKLGFVICIASAILAACGGVVIGLGVYMQLHIHDQLLLLESFNSGMLPSFLISVGTVMVLLNVVSAKVAIDASSANTSERIRMVLVPIIGILSLFSIVIMIAGIVCLTSRDSIEEALHNGLKDSMKRYKNNLNVKVAIDKLQIRSHCCGSRSYKDWFNVGWINTDYVNKNSHSVQGKMKDGDVYVDSVPFSCCSVYTWRPCTSHQIVSEYLYSIFDLRTLYQVGCTDTLMDELENKLLYPTGWFVHGLFVLQVLVTVLLRYLQTSVQSAYENGDIEGTGKGFCIPNACPAGCCPGDPDKYVKAGALHARQGDYPQPKAEADDSFIEEAQSVDMEDSFIGHAQEGIGIGQVQDFAGWVGGAVARDSQDGHDKHKIKNNGNKIDRSSTKTEPNRTKSKLLRHEVAPESANKRTQSTENKRKGQKSHNKMDSQKRSGGVGRKLSGRKR